MKSPFDDMPFSDQINSEIDHRKLKRLVDNGVITEEELRNAPIYYVHCPKDCDVGMEGNPLKCIACGSEGVSEELETP